MHTQLSFSVFWCPTIWQFSYKGFSMFCLKKTWAFSNGLFWTKRNEFLFFWGGKFKGQVKWALTLHIFFFVFLGGCLSCFWVSSFLFVFGLGFSFHGKKQHLTIQLQCFSLINPLFLFWFPVFVCLSICISFFFCCLLFAFVLLRKTTHIFN